MARERIIHVCVLSLAANPHPEGVYITLLRKAAQYLVKARGSDYAKITTPRKSGRDHIYTGRVLLWTEIDVKKPWLNLSNEDELSAELKKSIKIPPSAKPNFRAFNYVFHDRKHLLYVEAKNEFGDSLGPNTAKAIFVRLLSQELHGFDSPEVEVTVVPETGVVEKILALPELRTLFIRVTLPNPDAGSPAARRRVHERLKSANARQLDEKYTKSAEAEKLVATQEIRETAEVAAESGFVRGEGRDAEGKKLEVATDRSPKRLYLSMAAGGSFLSRLVATLKTL